MIGIVCAFFHTEGKGFYSSRQLRLYSRGSADPRESLRRRRISKLALSAHKVLPDQEARSLPLHLHFLKCTLESIPCVNDTVIYGTMYQVRKQMGGGLHKVCYDGAGDDAGESGQEGAGEGVSGFLDFGGYVVDAEGIEDSFGAAEDEGSGQADGGVGAVLFVEVEEETGGGA